MLCGFFELAAACADTEALELSAAWELLTCVDRVSPAALEAVLSHPYVQVWLVRCLERLRARSGNSGSHGPDLDAELGQLAAVAIAAAIRSGVSGSVVIPVRDGSIYLPTLGQLVLPGSRQRDLATIETSAEDVVSVRLGHSSWQAFWSAPALVFEGSQTARWRPVRQLSAAGLSVALEDTDPYRDCFQWPAAPRTSGRRLADWDRAFGSAWTLIRDDYGAYSPGLAAGLTTITPLSPPAPGREISATARNAFGAVAIAPVADGTSLALLLIHEFQHVKLGALLDLYDLFDPVDTRLFHAPWREDPRPLEGLLQGTYAHVAVTDFWRIRQRADGPQAQAAASLFARWRVHTARAIETLAASGSLTPLGQRLVQRMGETVTPWLGEPA